MSNGINRRQFLRGQFGRKDAPLRPPWALAEPRFLSACTRCDECIKNCPQHILASGSDGFPVVSFIEGECTFCGECEKRCEPHALERRGDEPPWQLKALIGEGCLAKANIVCRACGDSCAGQAIRFAPQIGRAAQPLLDATRCTGCGACYAPCPSRAVTIVAIDR